MDQSPSTCRPRFSKIVDSRLNRARTPTNGIVERALHAGDEWRNLQSRILRAQLEQEGARFRGNAETEVLLESFFALDAGLLAWRKFPAFLAWELFGSLRGGTF